MPRHAPTATRAGTLLVVLSVALLVACRPGVPSGGVHVLTVEGVIGPVVANYLERGIDQAEEAGAQAVVVRLDTPGGLDSSMRDMIQRINASTVPVIVYVSPSGARAASAGTFITMAAHVAAMAPNTAIGAAHPVSATGEDIGGDARLKAENDAAAYIRSIAQARGRNADWAERAVRESVSASAPEAVEQGVVDLEAASLDALLEEVDGREVTLAGGATATLGTAGAEQHANGMTAIERFLLVVSDPNIAFLLLSIGSLAIIIELFNPSGVGAAVGALALLVAFFSLGTLPTNWAGAGLVLLGVGLLTAELFIASGGILGIAGVAVMMFGGLFLTTTGNPQFEVSRWLVFGLPAVFGAMFAALGALLLRSRRNAPKIGHSALVGLPAEALGPVTLDQGWVSVQGERWRARLSASSAGRAVEPGDRLVVTSATGLSLTVEPAAEEASRGEAATEADVGDDSEQRQTTEG